MTTCWGPGRWTSSGCWRPFPTSTASSATWSRRFFFQAEDGIRDLTVTGVQTCALPICAARAAGFPQGPKRRRHDVHGSEPQPRPADGGRAAPQRVRRRGGLPAPVPGKPLSGLGLARLEPGDGHGGGHHRDAARRGALLPAARCRPAVRLDQDLTGGGRGRAAVRQSGGRDYPGRDELSAPVPGLRGERLGLPAAGRPAELEYLGPSAVAPSELSVSDLVSGRLL